jgi:hypothetical protein
MQLESPQAENAVGTYLRGLPRYAKITSAVDRNRLANLSA